MKYTLSLLAVLMLALNPAWSQQAAGNDPIVTIKTSEGDITLRLFREKSPVTVANFLSYVDSGHYEGTIFHRVIPDFMVQGGGFLPDMTEKATGEPIVNESRNRLHNVRGTVAMARTGDPDSATAQFFINQRSNLRLDWSPGQEGYTVFGEVIEGMSVVDYIASSPVRQWGGYQDVPVEPILIESVQRAGGE
ncbi:MAG TPA: peptidylprolyl isomerase [Haliea salexigens]|uniref:Peptidyl-prolyl cis-trans isomerase n=1 Tax=Haliea salexigens TaxID=287487 RepID=A0A3C1KQ37_9GAMM|nr:peptidylprolyl isomerase [Haliea sp.]HAN28820.1 peptidylprolyl isomerase [Haliea salexigens]|tara:strand:- start:5047 stop:5622 length:576 start_codon:yes stop_codon:yes gene_type:complete